ncbi:MAG TPA: glycoside hydrolase family 2 TIM barrel-domain containing protein [Tepidisphaeraceae bacterium]|nr:glycoside hydrolase family 2 TIM barrel-domain containing protein [Tepidisphaeraceae bacterium]
MSRKRINLNRDWRFHRGDIVGAAAVDFDDSNWERVGLPHTFDLPYFRTAEFYVGVGWYRKRVDTRGLRLTARTFSHWLEFDGAFQVAEIFINGRRVGEHRGGYTGFHCSGFEDGENMLAVRVSNEWDAKLAPRAGEHIFSGGLYRDVQMVFVPAVHVKWNGVAVATENLSPDRWKVHVTTEVSNETPHPVQCTARQIIIDADGDILASFMSTQVLQSQQSTEFTQTSDAIESPRLWHPDHPNLYMVRTEVLSDDEPNDVVETMFGFRWFEWTADRGFFLNGEHLYLRGVNAHQDHAGWGIGITQAACERDVRLIKEAGFNFVRGAHYPHHPAFADACDRLGLIFWSESTFWGKGGFGAEGYWNASAYPIEERDRAPFEEHCKQTLREMIRINRNHPSIVVWSMTNEAFFTYHLDRAKGLMRELVELSHQLDPTRPAAIGGAQRGGVDKIGDIAGYNGDGARLFIDPGVPNMVSEYGAISKPHDAYEPFFGELQPEPFPWRAGQAIWCGFDYGSIAGKQGLKGILHHNRLPKRSWYWCRNEHRQILPPPEPSDAPATQLQLSADKTTIRGTDATDDCQIVISALDAGGAIARHCPPVTLTIETGPGEFPTGPSITFAEESDIPIVAGQAAIAFRSYHAGQTLIRATAAGLKDATLTITTTGAPAFVEGETPRVAPRPYAPPPPSAAAVAAMKNLVNVARDRPSRASSEAERHPARFANDAHAATFWEAAEEGAAAWWQVDLEGFYQLSGCKLIFSAPASYRFYVEISNDGAKWTMAIDRRQSVRTDAVRNDIFDPDTVARYVRVTFSEVGSRGRAHLCELELHGVLSLR